MTKNYEMKTIEIKAAQQVEHNNDWIKVFESLISDEKPITFNKLPSDIQIQGLKPLDTLKEFFLVFKDYITKREEKWAKKKLRASGKKRYRTDFDFRAYFHTLFALAQAQIKLFEKPVNFYVFFEIRHFFNEQCYRALETLATNIQETQRKILAPKELQQCMTTLKSKIMVHNKLHSDHRNPWGYPQKLLENKHQIIQFRSDPTKLQCITALIYGADFNNNSAVYNTNSSLTATKENRVNSTCIPYLKPYTENKSFENSWYSSLAKFLIQHNVMWQKHASGDYLASVKFYFNNASTYWTHTTKEYLEVTSGATKALHDCVITINNTKGIKVKTYFNQVAWILTRFTPDLTHAQANKHNNKVSIQKHDAYAYLFKTILTALTFVSKEISTHQNKMSDQTLSELLLILNQRIVLEIARALSSIAQRFTIQKALNDKIQLFYNSLELLNGPYKDGGIGKILNSKKLMLPSYFLNFVTEFKKRNHNKQAYTNVFNKIPEIIPILNNRYSYKKMLSLDLQLFNLKQKNRVPEKKSNENNSKKNLN